MGLEKKLTGEDIVKEIHAASKDEETLDDLSSIIKWSRKVAEISRDHYKHLIARGYVRQEKGVLYATQKGIKRYEDHLKLQKSLYKMTHLSYKQLNTPMDI